MGMHIGIPVSGGTAATYNEYGMKVFTSSGTFKTKTYLKCDILVGFFRKNPPNVPGE